LNDNCTDFCARLLWLAYPSIPSGLWSNKGVSSLFHLVGKRWLTSIWPSNVGQHGIDVSALKNNS